MEKKNKRLNALVPLDVYDAVDDIAKLNNITVSEIVNRLLRDFVQKNIILVTDFRKFKNDVQTNFNIKLAQVAGSDSDE